MKNLCELMMCTMPAVEITVEPGRKTRWYIIFGYTKYRASNQIAGLPEISADSAFIHVEIIQIRLGYCLSPFSGDTAILIDQGGIPARPVSSRKHNSWQLRGIL